MIIKYLVLLRIEDQIQESLEVHIPHPMATKELMLLMVSIQEIETMMLMEFQIKIRMLAKVVILMTGKTVNENRHILNR